MKIENITNKNVNRLPDVELQNLKLRFISIYDRHFADPGVEKAVGLIRETFYKQYAILRMEMKKRKIKFYEGVALDLDKEVNRLILQRLTLGLDVSNLSEITVMKSYVAISGAFIESPKTAKAIDVVVRNAEENRDERLEKKITMVLKAHTGKTPNFIYSPPGPDGSYIPVFDLVLIAREETRRVDMAKRAIRIEKGAIPFKDLGMAEEATAWVGAKETAKAEVEDLRQICAWYDSAKPDIKGSYKLPHHRMSDKKAVWRAVAAAMGALLGARGGVAIPDADRKGVYNHLVGHYKQFDKEVPELKKYDAEELEKAFPIEKPEETENTIRIPVGPDCEVTATITIDKGQGISALYCGKIKKIRTFLFDKRVKAWTMASARAWITEHAAKVEKALHDGIDEGEQGDIQKQAIFKIVKIDKKKQIVGGIVYEPDVEDTQGDYANKEEIEKAMYRFMEKYATNTKRIRINHMGKKYFFPIIECFQTELDTVKGGQMLKAGTWWLMIKVKNEAIWKDIATNKLTGFSMGGSAKA